MKCHSNQKKKLIMMLYLQEIIYYKAWFLFCKLLKFDTIAFFAWYLIFCVYRLFKKLLNMFKDVYTVLFDCIYLNRLLDVNKIVDRIF